jgi:preprotein translocase subunit SecE
MSKRQQSVENLQPESQNQKGKDTLKLLAALLVLSASFVFYYLEAQLHALARAAVVLAGVGVAGYLVYLTETGKRWAHFLGETKKELRLVVWPTRKEVLQTTFMIVVVVIVMGIFLWLVDMFFLWAVEWLTGRGG